LLAYAHNAGVTLGHAEQCRNFDDVRIAQRRTDPTGLCGQRENGKEY
jgi:hypothetical protein